jgi:L-lactate dehydrogenase complex protein LldG
MSQSAVVEFQQSLSRADATSSLVTRDRFDEALDDAIEEPAIGAELSFPDLSLKNHPVTLDPSPDQLREARTGVTGSPIGISELGTVAVQSRSEGDEPASLFPERHVVVLRAADLRPDLESAFDWLREEFDAGRDSVVFETGPSATGDMGALVQGVHGPTEVHVIVVEDDE